MIALTRYDSNHNRVAVTKWISLFCVCVPCCEGWCKIPRALKLVGALEILEIARPRYAYARAPHGRVPLVSIQSIFLFDSNYVCAVLGIVRSNCYGWASPPLLTTSKSSTSYAKYAAFSSSAICTHKKKRLGGGVNRRCEMKTNNWKSLVVEIIELLRLAQWISRSFFLWPVTK